MRIGFILECSPKGPDADIYPYLAKIFCPKLEIEKPETLINKENVMTDGPDVAHMLLETGCDHVFIIWDRMPKWGGTGKCEDHISTLETGLNKLGVDGRRVTLCCIDEMLESWLVADGRGIDGWLSAKTKHDLPGFNPNSAIGHK